MFGRPLVWEIPGVGVVSTGCEPSPPDGRDYDIIKAARKIGWGTPTTHTVESLLGAQAVPPRVDLRAQCSGIENQGPLGCCTAAAVMGVAEAMTKRAFGTQMDGSLTALYRCGRFMADWVGLGDKGCTVRHVMAASAFYGIVPDSYWSWYKTCSPQQQGGGLFFDSPIPAETLMLGQRNRSKVYWRLDRPALSPDAILANIKQHLRYGILMAFGFFGFPTSQDSDPPSAFAFPDPSEYAIWAHAVTCVGYDDDFEVINTKTGKKTKGVFIIRNSWGTLWGENGYGYLPYAYLLHDPLWAWDWWAIYAMEMEDTHRFGIR